MRKLRIHYKQALLLFFFLCSDFTKKVTLQNLYHDGGFSNMGVSQALMDIVEEDS